MISCLFKQILNTKAVQDKLKIKGEQAVRKTAKNMRKLVHMYIGRREYMEDLWALISNFMGKSTRTGTTKHGYIQTVKKAVNLKKGTVLLFNQTIHQEMCCKNDRVPCRF